MVSLPMRRTVGDSGTGDLKSFLLVPLETVAMLSSAPWPSVSTTVANNRCGDEESPASNSKIYLPGDSVCDMNKFCDRWLRVTRRDAD